MRGRRAPYAPPTVSGCRGVALAQWPAPGLLRAGHRAEREAVPIGLSGSLRSWRPERTTKAGGGHPGALFHVGDGARLKAEGYGGHPVKVRVRRRRPGQVIARLDDAGFTVETHRTLGSAGSTLGESSSLAAGPIPGRAPPGDEQAEPFRGVLPVG
ncbi:hypothetical protein SUDANB126_06735 [Streptomyces sp. enrichment culture]